MFTIVFCPLNVISDDNIYEIPVFSKPPRIDGILDNPLWEEEALKIENFTQFIPKEMGTPSEKTVAYLGCDTKNLYVAFRCFDSNPMKIRASVTNRDNIRQDDWVSITIDTFNEKRRAFGFNVNPLGVQSDGIRTEEGGGRGSGGMGGGQRGRGMSGDSWDTVFSSDGKINHDGYTVEIAIPFKSLRFPKKENKIWRVILTRNISRKGEIITWPVMKRSISGSLPQAAQIKLPSKIATSNNIEIIPVITGLQKNKEKMKPEEGINLKYGLTSNLTLDFAYNPDFSQVEADVPQIELNQRYALYYPEKRPFFLEGEEIFQSPFGLIDLIYTRRITDPLWGAKLTGKVGPFTLGYISAMDEKSTESLWEISDSNNTEITQLKALFNIFRMKADIFKESFVGFTLTDKYLYDPVGNKFSRAGGIDGQFKWQDNFYLTFQVLGSQKRPSENEKRFSSAQYYNFKYDSRNFYSSIYYKSIAPDFEAASGFVNRTDFKEWGGIFEYNILPQKKFLTAITPQIQIARWEDFKGIPIEERNSFELRIQFTANTFFSTEYFDSMERFADIDFKKKRYEARAFSNILWWLTFWINYSQGDTINYDEENPFLGWGQSFNANITLRPSDRLNFSINYNKNTLWKDKNRKELMWDYDVIRNRITYQLTKELSIRTIVDYDHYYKELFGNFLLSYIYRPGTVFFLGFDSNYLVEENNGYYRLNRTNKALFVKFSYWIRI
ncbi:MAG: DUF5916 domain-containing protein [Acidobacteriota bacterium]